MQIGYGQPQKIEVRYDNSASPGQDCALHRLIHTLLEFDLTQYVEAHAVIFSVSGVDQPCNSDSILAN